MKKIDVFNHILPEPFFAEFLRIAGGLADMGKRVRNLPALYDLTPRFRVMDEIQKEFGDYSQVVSLASPPIEAFADSSISPMLAEIANDGMAELVHHHRDRFPAFLASLPMNNRDASMKELDRALSHLHAVGVQLYTNVAGKPLDDPEFAPLFDELARRDCPVFLHPARTADMTDYKSEARSKFEIWWTLGWPYETSAAMARLVFSGVFDRHPDLKIVTHHMGAMIPYFEGRVGHGWDQLGLRTTDGHYGDLLKSMARRPLDYFKMFYADTALFGAASATRCGLDFFGVDRVLFASDTPFEPTPGLFVRETIRVIENLELPDEEKHRIYHGNAEKLLKL
ncbi:MAG TPA: amidohydrolase family protein [Bryobacteraceae bacterium]|nr:amidohydrolase family protein [Bryobacteraceae bacterium]